MHYDHFCSSCGSPSHSCSCGGCKPHHDHHSHPPAYKPEPCSTKDWKDLERYRCELEQLKREGCKSLAEMQQALNKLRCQTNANGAYYSDICVEEKYSAESSTKYYVTHIPKRSRCSNKKIKMELHVAYNSTLNDRVKEDAFEASQYEAAQVLVPFMRVDDTTGWFGHCRYKEAALPSSTAETLYTAGFTVDGRLRWYSNSVDAKQLSRDRIENSMGVYGILVTGAEVTDEAYRSSIPGYNQTIARVGMGQNHETGEVIIVSCGDEDTNGMTSQTLAMALRSEGCHTAVELCQGNDVVNLDRGEVLFPPTNNNIPSTYGYWYVSKKREYCSDFTWELARLQQKYGQAIWQGILNAESIKNINIQIENIWTMINSQGADIEEIKKKIQEMAEQIQSLQDSVASLQGQINNIVEDIAKLREDLNKEIADRVAEVQRLDAEIAALKLKDIEQDGRLTTLESRVDQALADIIQLRSDLTLLQQLEAQHYNELKGLITLLQDRMNSLEARQLALEQQMTALDAALTEYIISLTELETAINNLKETVTNLVTRITQIESSITIINNTIEDLQEQINNIEVDIPDDLLDRLDAIEAKNTNQDSRLDTLESYFNPQKQEVTSPNSSAPLDVSANDIFASISFLGNVTGNLTATDAGKWFTTIGTSSIWASVGAGRAFQTVGTLLNLNTPTITDSTLCHIDVGSNGLVTVTFDDPYPSGRASWYIGFSVVKALA